MSNSMVEKEYPAPKERAFYPQLYIYCTSRTRAAILDFLSLAYHCYEYTQVVKASTVLLKFGRVPEFPRRLVKTDGQDPAPGFLMQ